MRMLSIRLSLVGRFGRLFVASFGRSVIHSFGSSPDRVSKSIEENLPVGLATSQLASQLASQSDSLLLAFLPVRSDRRRRSVLENCESGSDLKREALCYGNSVHQMSCGRTGGESIFRQCLSLAREDVLPQIRKQRSLFPGSERF